MEKWYASHIKMKTGQENALLSSRTFKDAVTYWLSQNSAPKKQQQYKLKKEQKNHNDWIYSHKFAFSIYNN